MAEPLRVAVRRGTFVESVHEVHGVALREGEIAVSFGDPSLTASLRSAAKPLQALPLARAYPELGDEELAIAAALEAEPKGGRLRALLTGQQVADPAGRHQVHEQHELAVIRREQEPLGAPLRA